MDRATVILAAITGPDDRIIDRLAVDLTDRELMTNPENDSGFCTFLAGEDNGIAYIDPVYVAVRWGSRPAQWFSHDVDCEDEFAIIEAAINDELPAA